MIPTNRVTEHPGKFLGEMLEELKITLYDFISRNGLSMWHVEQVIAGNMSMTADMMIAASKEFNQTAYFWYNLQKTYDLTKIEQYEKMKDAH